MSPFSREGHAGSVGRSAANCGRPPAEPRPCPTLGQDNPMILSEILGLDEDAITELVIAGVIQ